MRQSSQASLSLLTTGTQYRTPHPSSPQALSHLLPAVSIPVHKPFSRSLPSTLPARPTPAAPAPGTQPDPLCRKDTLHPQLRASPLAAATL